MKGIICIKINIGRFQVKAINTRIYLICDKANLRIFHSIDIRYFGCKSCPTYKSVDNWLDEYIKDPIENKYLHDHNEPQLEG